MVVGKVIGRLYILDENSFSAITINQSIQDIFLIKCIVFSQVLGHTSPIVTKHILGINNKDVDSNSLCEIYSLVK